ncbi:MAG: Flp pilus assembly complex ATPase component TadA [Planctomycetes bacterium]|nr:Flp pilus assembly complex ATPase component TadA [Planctomycetota bacterium]
MPDLLLTSVIFGSYISIVKLIVFMALFFGWLWLITWIYDDAIIVETKEVFWSSLVFGIGAGAALLWMMIPIFVVGLAVYMLAVSVSSIVYVIHRNTRVMQSDKILTLKHIQSLLIKKDKNAKAQIKGFTFYTANKNEVPKPQAKSKDFHGYKAAHDIINDALEKRTSSIIFSPTPHNYSISYNIDGVNLKQPEMEVQLAHHLIRFLKQLADLNIEEKRKPQKGRFKIRKDDDVTDWEILCAGSTAGEQFQLRLMTQEVEERVSDIGLLPKQLTAIDQLKNIKHGIVLVTGPKRSGVTTTFYAMLRNHDAFLNSINTFERKPTAVLPNIIQDTFELTDTGTSTFSKRLRSIYRMGPDIVGVAGCHDSDTAKEICNAAQNDILSYVVIEADSVMKALSKWIKLVGDRKLATETLSGICNQRLLRKLCEECKQGYSPNKELLRKFNLPADKTKVMYREGKVIYDKHGKPSTCPQCHGIGFIGRTGIFEMILLNDNLKQAMLKAKSMQEIGSVFRGAKMLYLQEQGLNKVIAGVTSVNEMIRALSSSALNVKKPVKKKT